MLSIQSIVLILFISTIAVEGQIKIVKCKKEPKQNLIQLKKITIAPHPIKAPGFALFTLETTIKEDFTEPIRTQFDMVGKVGIFSSAIACPDNPSCVYNNWCEFPSGSDLCPVLAGTQIMKIPMNLTATIPIGSSAKVSAEISFRSRTNQEGCVRIENVDVKK